jgi:hypothetical protein
VLGDDREQVREQLVLERREIVRYRERAVVAVLGTVDGAVGGDGDGRFVGLERAAGDDGRGGVRRELGTCVDGAGFAAAVQAAASVMSLLVRYRRPSSSRRW